MSHDNSILSDVIPAIRTLDQVLSIEIEDETPAVTITKNRLRASLQQRFMSTDPGELNIMTEREYIMSTFIDPRYKTNFFTNNRTPRSYDASEQAKLYILQDISKSTTQHEDPPVPEPPAKKARTSSLYAEVFKQFASTSAGRKRPRSEDEDEGEKELEKYLQLPLLEKDEDPLTWWRQNRTTLPLLAKLARKLLCTPASSVYSERIFSEFGEIYDDQRSRILPARGEKLLFIHHNYRKYAISY